MELYFSEINISKCFNTHEALIIMNNDKGISKHIKCIRQMTYTQGFLRSIERDNQTQIITSRGPGFQLTTDKVCFYNLNKNKTLTFEGNKSKGNTDGYLINAWSVGP